MAASTSIIVNGKTFDSMSDPSTPLLFVLRNELHLKAPKFGCGLGQCGSCMVLIDGRTVYSCQIPIQSVAGKEITTLEGLPGEEQKLHAVQEAFIECSALQCGYCTNGMIMASIALLDRNPSPTDEEIKSGLQGNLCRCGAHARVIKAVRRASEILANQ